MAQREKIAAYLEAGPGKDFFVEVKVENGTCRKKFIPTPVELEKHMLDAICEGYVVSLGEKSEDLKEAYESAKSKFLSEDIPNINVDNLEDDKINFTPNEWVYLHTGEETYKVKFKEDSIYGCTVCGLLGRHICHKVNCDKGFFMLQGEVR